MTAPRLTDLPLWSRFEGRALRVLRQALTLLPETEPDLDLDEPSLNRLLYASIAEANRLINIEDQDGFESMPSYDGHQAPDNTSRSPEEFERKRPDFTWSLHDHTAPSGLEGCREFVVECKRLGQASDGPRFNNLYVDKGIVRFVRDSHKYGLRGRSGAMVGYIQRADNYAVLADVQARSMFHSLGELAILDGLDAVLAELRQLLTRTFGASPFELVHLWVDLRQPD